MKKILASMFLSDVSWELLMVDLGEGPGGPRPPSYFGKKKKELQKEEKDSRASNQKNQPPPPPPPLTQGWIHH